MTRVVGPLVVLVVVLALAPAAQAASVRADALAKTVSFTAGAGEANRVAVSQSGRTITFRDPASDVRSVVVVNASCNTRSSGTETECTMPASAADFTVRVAAGDGDDRVTAPIARPVHLTGGTGNDELVGGTAPDQLTGDAGADTLDGGAGADQITAGADDDRIVARDGAIDSVSCGDGADALDADADDAVGEDCEGVAKALATPTLAVDPTRAGQSPTATDDRAASPAGPITVDPLTQMSGEPPAGMPAPEAGQAVALGVKSGTALVRRPGEKDYAPVEGPQRLPVGTSVDARQGIVSLVSARDLRGTRQAADFSGAVFTVAQRRGRSMVTVLTLRGGDFRSCRPARRTAARAAARAPKTRKGSIRRLWGSGHGRFTTRGRDAAATVRGTIWSVSDSCAGTTTRVERGVVAVRDFGTRRTRLVRKGQSYLARARGARRR
jgi:hypothetical protein